MTRQTRDGWTSGQHWVTWRSVFRGWMAWCGREIAWLQSAKRDDRQYITALHQWSPYDHAPYKRRSGSNIGDAEQQICCDNRSADREKNMQVSLCNDRMKPSNDRSLHLSANCCEFSLNKTPPDWVAGLNFNRFQSIYKFVFNGVAIFSRTMFNEDIADASFTFRRSTLFLSFHQRQNDKILNETLKLCACDDYVGLCSLGKVLKMIVYVISYVWLKYI